MSCLFPALGYRNFRLFWSGQIVSLTGSWMHSMALGWLVFNLTNSPFYLGLVGTVGSLPILLFSLIGGVAADRFPRKELLLVTQVLFLLLALVLAVLVSMDIVEEWHILTLAFIIGTINAFDIPARHSFILEIVGKESLLNAIALNSAAFNGTRIIGPAIAGFLIRYMDIAACFYINALSYAAVIFSFMKIRLDARPEADASRLSLFKELHGKQLLSNLKEGIKYIFTEPRVHTLIILVAITSLFGFPYITFLPVYAKEILKTGAGGLGVLMGASGAGALTGAIGLALKEDFNKKGLLFAVSGTAFPLALLVFAYSETPWLSALMLFFVGWSAVSQIATANSIIQITVPDNLRGRIMSAFTLMFIGMTTVGNFIVGSIAHYAGTQNAVASGAVLCLSGVILLLWRRPAILKS